MGYLKLMGFSTLSMFVGFGRGYDWLMLIGAGLFAVSVIWWVIDIFKSIDYDF